MPSFTPAAMPPEFNGDLVDPAQIAWSPRTKALEAQNKKLRALLTECLGLRAAIPVMGDTWQRIDEALAEPAP